MKRILIIGAGFLQNFVIQKAKNLGYETYVLDGDPNAVGFKNADHYEAVNIVDERACLEYARKNQVDGVLTAATDYGVLTAAYIAQEMHLPGLNYETAKLVKNKYLVRKRLLECHVDDTEQAYEIDANTDLESICEKLTFPVMVKPCDGSGSRGASRVDSSMQFEEACQVAMNSSATYRAEVESVIFGQEYGAESFVENGKIHVHAIMRKWMSEPPYYAELGHAIPSGLPTDIESRVKCCVENAVKALGINFGSVNMDMLITAEGKVHIIDVGARMGGNLIGSHIIPYGTGIDYMGAMIQNAVSDPVVINVSKHSSVATRLLTFTPGIVKRLPDFESLERQYGVEIYHHMQVGQKVNAYHTNLDGLGYIVARAEDVDAAVKKADKVLDIIRNNIFC